MARIASRVSKLNGEGALAVFARAKELEKLGRSIIHLELGEPDFHPAAPVVDALRSAVAPPSGTVVTLKGGTGGGASDAGDGCGAGLAWLGGV